MSIETASRSALQELISVLTEIDERWSGPEWNLHSEADVTESHRALMHLLEAGLVGYFEEDPVWPRFRRIMTPSRKIMGDNPDCIFFDTTISADHSYFIRGNLHGAAYFSLSIEEGTEFAGMPTKTALTIKDSDIAVDETGNFEIYLGGDRRDVNWFPLSKDASRIISRHYFEVQQPANLDPAKESSLHIECLSNQAALAPVNDQTVAAGIRRVTNFLKVRTLDKPPMVNTEPPPFVSLTPNDFPAPVGAEEEGSGASADAHYSMAPFFLNHDEALVVTGRWPDCRYAGVCLWNRFQQSYDYETRSAALNRSNTKLESDGCFKIILAHEDPGHPNWLDTQGNLFGMVFWRYLLVTDDEVQKPEAKVVKFDELKTL